MIGWLNKIWQEKRNQKINSDRLKDKIIRDIRTLFEKEEEKEERKKGSIMKE